MPYQNGHPDEDGGTRRAGGRPYNRRVSKVLVALVLVGVPLGAFAAARATAPAPHRVSRLGLVSIELTAMLEQRGVSDIRCGWAGSAGGPITVSCTGTVPGEPSSLGKTLAATVNARPGDQ